MSRSFIAGIVSGLAMVAVGCGSNYGTSTPTSPSDSPAPPAGATVINVVGINGAQSFSPNPSTVPVGQPVVWHNVDTVTHRVVLNDGRLDTGNLAPGAFSQSMTLAAPGTYHCSIHPEMVGTIVANP
jgi:plastocyanin